MTLKPSSTSVTANYDHQREHYSGLDDDAHRLDKLLDGARENLREAQFIVDDEWFEGKLDAAWMALWDMEYSPAAMEAKSDRDE